jgi:hypothetical protein
LDQETFSGNTALSGILHAGIYRNTNRFVQIGIFTNNKSVASA